MTRARAGHSVVYIAAKAPRAGLSKTRLGRGIGDQGAVALYRAFLRDLGATFAAAPYRVGWYVTPDDAWGDIAPLLGARGRPTGPVLIQGEGDWAARQRALFLGAPARGEDRTILVASDSPQLTVGLVARAFALLDRHDVVLGPVVDGGYYLLGVRGGHDVLDDVRMSTRTVFADIIHRARRLGLAVGTLPATFDVDVADDLVRLRDVADNRPDLPATRAALGALGRVLKDRVAAEVAS